MDRSTIVRGTIANGTTAYAAGDQVGIVVPLTGWQIASNTVTIESVTLIQSSGYAGAFDLHFFDTSPTVVADNAAGTFSYADMQGHHLGMVKIATTDITNVGGQFVATLRNVELKVQSNSGTLYLNGITQGTQTFTAVSHVVVVLGIEQGG